MSNHTDKLRQHLAGILGEQPTEVLESLGGEPEESLEEGLTTLAEDEQELGLALTGLEHFQADEDFTDDEAFALEAIVLPRERPVVDIMADSYHQPPPPWRHIGQDPHKQNITAAIPSIGRVEIPNHPSAPYGGTGFVVGSDLIMTNRHVAETFAMGVGLKQLLFIPGRSPGIDFKQEVLPSEPVVLDFESVEMIHPYWDCALVRVNGLQESHPPLVLDGAEADNVEGLEVAIVGYPAQDHRNDLQLQFRIFRGVFQRKRLQPGRLTGYRKVRSYGNTVDAISHDGSTLGGNSGSAVIDIETGHVVGLHFAGIYLEANYAVPTWELARDPKVVDAGVNFQDAPANGDLPPLERCLARCRSGP